MNIAMRQKRSRPKPILIADRRATDLPTNSIVGEIRVVNPLGGEPGEMVRNLRRELEANPQDKIVVVRSLRDDPLGRLHARGQLCTNDDPTGMVKLDAGRRWQDLYEATEIGGARGIDTTKDVVDGGRGPSDHLTDRRLKAAKKLALADHALGQQGSWLVRAVLGQRLFVKDVADVMGLPPNRRSTDYVADRLRECLSTLALTI